MTEQVEKVYREIGERVAMLRARQGLTQHELAGRLPLKRSTLANLERGRHRIMLHDLVPLAYQFGMTTSQFLKEIPCLHIRSRGLRRE